LLQALTFTSEIVIVSHDSGFLNNTITDVLHLDRFKVRRYRGNLEAFVKAVPEAKSYYTLDAAEDYKFKLPDPPLLDGVKTKEKSLLKMRKVGFQYPTQTKQQLYDITLQVSLSSRVAILGPNGSGKSTLVKLLIGDMEPNKGGEVWKHPNLVIGYVAQHAFHHIDHHLDKTPLEYMLWRYQTGEDLEELQKANRIISEAEQKKMTEGGIVVIEGVKRMIDEIVSRKKLKQSYEYEVSFKNLSSTENVWLSRDELIQRGYEKKVIEVDTREAQRLGLLRPLVRREIEKHFADFGLESEFVSHNTMRGLSGGQKVKVVLGAATWRRPHVICLDEPTNYLDRESLAALIEALKEFQGGVLIITHNRDFSESICKEVWAMRDGYLEASGHNWVEGQGSGPRIDTKDGDNDDQYDAMGNKIDKAKIKKKQRPPRPARPRRTVWHAKSVARKSSVTRNKTPVSAVVVFSLTISIRFLPHLPLFFMFMDHLLAFHHPHWLDFLSAWSNCVHANVPVIVPFATSYAIVHPRASRSPYVLLLTFGIIHVVLRKAFCFCDRRHERWQYDAERAGNFQGAIAMRTVSNFPWIEQKALLKRAHSSQASFLSFIAHTTICWNYKFFFPPFEVYP
jgi:ATPase subunit of ABC transporter with duplicated ATPase domains